MPLPCCCKQSICDELTDDFTSGQLDPARWDQLSGGWSVTTSDGLYFLACGDVGGEIEFIDGDTDITDPDDVYVGFILGNRFSDTATDVSFLLDYEDGDNYLEIRFQHSGKDFKYDVYRVEGG